MAESPVNGPLNPPKSPNNGRFSRHEKGFKLNQRFNGLKNSVYDSHRILYRRTNICELFYLGTSPLRERAGFLLYCPVRQSYGKDMASLTVSNILWGDYE